jgi:hypothetical protein
LCHGNKSVGEEENIDVSNNVQMSHDLGLRVGEAVEVRSAEEIRATLDEHGCLDSLPFMPEMLRFCHKRFIVYKRADKTCDTVNKTGGRRLFNTVHLRAVQQPEGMRCDGAAHGGCEAGCLLFWHEAWLKRAEPQARRETGEGIHDRFSVPPGMETMLCGAAVVEQPGKDGAQYRCQATQLNAYSRPLAWWDIRQYIRDLTSGNVRVGDVGRALAFAGYRKVVSFGFGWSLLVGFYNWFQERTGGSPWPYVQGTLSTTPTGELNLAPGELVRVKSLPQILATLDTRNKNRGLLFPPEMVRFCGGTFKVLKRVHRIVDEKNGRMLEFSNPCIVLQNVYCLSEFSRDRVFCPRAIYSYWREIWLRILRLAWSTSVELESLMRRARRAARRPSVGSGVAAGRERGGHSCCG